MRLILFVLLQLSLSGSAFAWGALGHRTVALIAEHYLDPAVAERVKELLSKEGSSSIVEVAKWADSIRPENRPDAPHHSVRLPLNSSGYNQQRDCPSGHCIVEALKSDIQILRESKDDQARLVALKYIVHFLGDIHSPLQVIKRKASRLMVSGGGVTMPVAKFWDNQGPARTKLGERALADEIISTHAGKSVSQGGPEQWAVESRNVAMTILQGLPDENTGNEAVALSASYLNNMTPVVEDQLYKAGVRLAGVLNAALK